MRIKRARRTLTVAAGALALGLVAMPGPAAAENYRFKIASGHNENWHFIQLGRDFFIPEVKKRIAERTPHKADFLQGWASAIVKATEVLEGTQSGVIDFGLFCICHEGGKLALHNFPYYLPFGPTDPSISVKATRKVYDQIPEINQQLEKNYNQKMIALIPFDVYDVISKFPFEKAEAVKGHKIGGAGPNLPWIGRMGASPVSVTGPEVYTALQTGLFDALIAFVSIMDALKLYPVAPYYVQVGFGSMTIVGLTMNLNSFNKLPKEVQDIIVEVGRETEERSGPFIRPLHRRRLRQVHQHHRFQGGDGDQAPRSGAPGLGAGAFELAVGTGNADRGRIEGADEEGAQGLHQGGGRRRLCLAGALRHRLAVEPRSIRRGEGAGASGAFFLRRRARPPRPAP